MQNVNNYGYRAIPVSSPRVAGIVARGNRSRGLRKGEAFVLDRPTNVILNSVNGQARTVTVLDTDGRAVVRLDARSATF